MINHVNIHTHLLPESNEIAVRNLTFSEAETIFPTQEKGYYSLGIHPWHVHQVTEKQFTVLEQILTDKRFVAIGECGLDKNAKATVTNQVSTFERQIVLSEKTGKPVIIHCVGYFNELFEIRKLYNPKQKWIIHGFRGKPKLAEQALKTGCCLSFGEKFNTESVRLTPPECLYIETDESKLPVNIFYQKIAEIKACSVDELNAGMLLISEAMQ